MSGGCISPAGGLEGEQEGGRHPSAPPGCLLLHPRPISIPVRSQSIPRRGGSGAARPAGGAAEPGTEPGAAGGCAGAVPGRCPGPGGRVCNCPAGARAAGAARARGGRRAPLPRAHLLARGFALRIRASQHQRDVALQNAALVPSGAMSLPRLAILSHPVPSHPVPSYPIPLKGAQTPQPFWSTDTQLIQSQALHFADQSACLSTIPCNFVAYWLVLT